MRWFHPLFFLLPVSLSSCDRDAVIAQVGQFTIIRQDVAWRDAIHRLYFPWDERKLGLEELEHAFTAAQILINHGYPITPEVIEAEERRIQQTTLMPERLARIQRVFQGNQDGYRRVFVMPTLVERVIYYDFFCHDPKAQAESLGKVEMLLANTKKNSSNLWRLAQEAGYSFSTFTISLANGIEWRGPVQASKDKGTLPPTGMPPRVAEALKKNDCLQLRKEAQRWIAEVVAPLQQGQICVKAVDFGEEWLVVRLLGPTPQVKDSYELECVSIPKDPYEPWLQSESKKVPVIRK
jgi:hypothetical protein